MCIRDRSWKSRPRQGRPPVSMDVRELIRRMSRANPGWGAPRIHGELGKLGIKVSETTVAKYMVRQRHPPSTDLAHLLDQSREGTRLRRFLRGSDRHIPV